MKFLPALALVLLVAGCAKRSATDPPEIYFGQDICGVCGMIISDERYAAGLTVVRNKRATAMAFDDIGCLLEAEAAPPGGTVTRWVRAYGAGGWLEAGDAFYVQSSDLHSPMAFGVAATPSEAEARALEALYPGALLDFDELRRRFESGGLRVDPRSAESLGERTG